MKYHVRPFCWAFLLHLFIANAWVQVYLVTGFLARAGRVLKHLALAAGSYAER
jgi:hypothetical protein